MKPTILIAEDSKPLGILFRRVLPRFLPDYSVVVCTNRVEALASYRAASKVAALVIDRFLPPGVESQLDTETAKRLRPRDDSVEKEGGLVLIREIAKMAGVKKRLTVPTLYISADYIPWGDRQWLEKLHAPGTRDELIKPFEIKHLAERLLRLIDSSRRGGS